jgi:hypothetical protein
VGLGIHFLILPSLSIFIDFSLSRYTDPDLGIAVELSVRQLEQSPVQKSENQVMKLKFDMGITDYAPGGLPSFAMKFLLNNIGPHKCIDERTKVELNQSEPVSKGRSSRTGLPHIVELYHQLTAHGGDDFELQVTTRDSGTSFRMRFVMSHITPIVTPQEEAASGRDKNPFGVEITGPFS